MLLSRKEQVYLSALATLSVKIVAHKNACFTVAFQIEV